MFLLLDDSGSNRAHANNWVTIHSRVHHLRVLHAIRVDSDIHFIRVIRRRVICPGAIRIGHVDHIHILREVRVCVFRGVDGASRVNLGYVHFLRVAARITIEECEVIERGFVVVASDTKKDVFISTDYIIRKEIGFQLEEDFAGDDGVTAGLMLNSNSVDVQFLPQFTQTASEILSVPHQIPDVIVVREVKPHILKKRIFSFWQRKTRNHLHQVREVINSVEAHPVNFLI